MAILGRFTKQPAEVQDYDVNYVEFLAGFSDTATGHAVEVADGISLTGSTLNGGVIKVWLAGGTDGQDYKITVRITTAGGRIKEDEFVIKVREK